MNSDWIYLDEALAIVRCHEGTLAEARIMEALKREEIRARAETWYSISGLSLDARGREDRLTMIPSEFWERAAVIWNDGDGARNWARLLPTSGDAQAGAQLDASRIYDVTGIHVLRADLLKLWPAVSDRPAPMTTSGKSAGAPEPAARKRGPKSAVGERVKAEMRTLPPSELKGLKEAAMAVMFGASRDTCRKARDEVLSEFRAQ